MLTGDDPGGFWKTVLGKFLLSLLVDAGIKERVYLVLIDML